MVVSSVEIGENICFTVYIQDANGNPPVTGTAFKAIYTPYAGEEEESEPVTLIDVIYPDVLTYRGTFRDPSDPATDNPYIVYLRLNSGDKLAFIYEPTCSDEVPGCSGGDSTQTFIGVE